MMMAMVGMRMMRIMKTSMSSWLRVQPQAPRLSVSSFGKTLLGITPTPR